MGFAPFNPSYELLQNRAADRRCATRRLRARPPPEPNQARCHFYLARPVTFQPCADMIVDASAEDDKMLCFAKRRFEME
jgi:hypothetical protein